MGIRLCFFSKDDIVIGLTISNMEMLENQNDVQVVKSRTVITFGLLLFYVEVII